MVIFHLLIHSANPKSRPEGIVFAYVVRLSVRPHFTNLEKQNTMFATGVTMGLAEWIIDDTYLVTFVFVNIKNNEISLGKLTSLVILIDLYCNNHNRTIALNEKIFICMMSSAYTSFIYMYVYIYFQNSKIFIGIDSN